MQAQAVNKKRRCAVRGPKRSSRVWSGTVKVAHRSLNFVFLPVAWAIALSSCGAGPVSLSTVSRAFTADDYNGIYNRWTRNADDFEIVRMSEVAHVTATFESWEFRWAYVVRYARDHALDTAARQSMLDEALHDSTERHRFFVTFAAPIYREGDLTGDRSDWRVILVDAAGHQTEPVEFTRIPRPSRDLRTYFPSVNRQRHTFRISFPAQSSDGVPTIPSDATHIILRFASSLGIVDLRWDFERPQR